MFGNTWQNKHQVMIEHLKPLNASLPEETCGWEFFAERLYSLYISSLLKTVAIINTPTDVSSAVNMVLGGGIIYISLEVLIAVGCCLGNVLVIWAVQRSGTLNQTTFCLIVSLAMADFLVGAVAIPLAVVVDTHVNISFHACLFISCVLIVPLQASVLTLLAIAVDRCLRVCIPFRWVGLQMVLNWLHWMWKHKQLLLCL